jgi:hypothetical protein
VAEKLKRDIAAFCMPTAACCSLPAEKPESRIKSGMTQVGWLIPA